MILQKRFGNKQQIIARHMDILLNTDAVTSQYNLKALRQLYDLVESHIRSLRSLGVPADSYGTLLSSVLLNKLPQEFRLIISRKTGNDDWNLDFIMKEMEEEIKARERSALNPASLGTPVRRSTKEVPTAAALFSRTYTQSCCYCQQEHCSDKCGVVTQVEARKQVLKKAGRCFVCLRRGHIGRECRSRSRCSNCGGRHHLTICLKSGPRSSSAPSSNPGSAETPDSNTTQAAGLNPEASSFRPPPTTTLYVDASQTVLLQTAQAQVYNPETPQSLQRVRAVLDQPRK